MIRKKFRLKYQKYLHRKEGEVSSYKQCFSCSYHTVRCKLQPQRAPKLMMLSDLNDVAKVGGLGRLRSYIPKGTFWKIVYHSEDTILTQLHSTLAFDRKC